jgi:uncharacterized membrane protein
VPRTSLLAVALSLAGVGVSIYLTALHYAGFAPACPATGVVNCEAVLTSPYAVIAGTSVPTSATGIAWFAMSAVLWLRPFGWIQLVWSAVGLVTVLYLVFVEIVRLSAICLWCTAAHVLVLALVLIAVTLWQGQRGAY